MIVCQKKKLDYTRNRAFREQKLVVLKRRLSFLGDQPTVFQS